MHDVVFLEPLVGIEPTPQPYKGCILAIKLQRQKDGASYRIRTDTLWLEAKHAAVEHQGRL